jgi:hypothetical protein
VTPQDPDVSPQLDNDDVTREVGDEGGTPGDLETTRKETGRGSEAGEIWRPAESRPEDVNRDDAPGRRSP